MKALALAIALILSACSGSVPTAADRPGSTNPGVSQATANDPVPTPSDAPPTSGSDGDWGPLAVVPPQDGADTARTEGTLRVTDDCVFLATPGGLVLLVWPADRTAWNVPARTITFSNYDGSTVTAADRTPVVLGGSGASDEDGGDTAEVWLARTPWVARPAASCPLDSRWWVGALTR